MATVRYHFYEPCFSKIYHTEIEVQYLLIKTHGYTHLGLVSCGDRNPNAHMLKKWKSLLAVKLEHQEGHRKNIKKQEREDGSAGGEGGRSLERKIRHCN